MSRLTRRYVLGRAARLVLTVWLGLTLMFIIPRLGRSSPADAIIAKLAAGGGAADPSLVNAYEKRLGLHESLWHQYLDYLWNAIRFDQGYSLSEFPATVNSIVLEALPWTFGLVISATLISFVMGTLIGAIMGWPKSPRALRRILPITLLFSSLPAFMIGIVLLFLFAQQWHLLPFSGAYSADVVPGPNLPFVSSVVSHAILPLLSVVLVQMGAWAMGMRGMLITTTSEDYVMLAEAKGLRPHSVFLHYGIRTAILPQVTSLGLALGTAAGGVVVVETVFAYPGLGNLLYQAILANDYTVIEGVAFFLILGVSVSTFLLDLVYPFLDPRIDMRGR
ncbi:ABC transporter permease [Embleya scabrispora]|uniref:ABC transporter permease n=1 Tax=Embleya scabrispora TaxID=159449 RepID=UPI0003654B77|nr:ABC transporter permease [Embleya scabrispora]MYS85111.1 ABC transporter permease subunit [Streptomyces sp. SID5474]